jgi:spoIIIJ-associated protein
MSDERTTLEIIAPTVDEAVSKGLADLGLPLEAVDVEVLDAGSRGLFGLGSRQARIRLSMKKQPQQAPVAPQRVAAQPKPVELAQEETPVEPVQSEPTPAEGGRPQPAGGARSGQRAARENESAREGHHALRGC